MIKMISSVLLMVKSHPFRYRKNGDLKNKFFTRPFSVAFSHKVLALSGELLNYLLRQFCLNVKFKQASLNRPNRRRGSYFAGNLHQKHIELSRLPLSYRLSDHQIEAKLRKYFQK
jgi:hypothetical protein